MSMGKKILQALLGLILICAAALAMGTWVFPAEKDLIHSLRGFRISVTGIGAGLSLLTMLAFADGWVGARNRSDSESAGAGRLMNGLGFGLLPGILIWKIFEQGTLLARGFSVPEGFPAEGWFSQAGCWLPDRLEMALAAILFAAVVLWLALRREALPEHGDLFSVSLAAWGAVRVVTESFRAEQIALLGNVRIVGWLAAAAMAVPTLLWTGRNLRQKRNTAYVLACVPVFLISLTGIVLIQNDVVRIGVPAADLIMQICLVLLALKSTLCLGRVSREE